MPPGGWRGGDTSVPGPGGVRSLSGCCSPLARRPGWRLSAGRATGACAESPERLPQTQCRFWVFFLKYLIEFFSYSWLLFCFVSGVFFVRVRAPLPWLCSRSPARCSRFSPAAAGRVLDGRGPGRPGDRTAAAPARGTSSPAVSGAVPDARCVGGAAGAEGRDGAGRPRLRQRGAAAAGAAGRPSPLERHHPGGQGAGWARAANPPARGSAEGSGRHRGTRRPAPPGEMRERRVPGGGGRNWAWALPLRPCAAGGLREQQRRELGG